MCIKTFIKCTPRHELIVRLCVNTDSPLSSNRVKLEKQQLPKLRCPQRCCSEDRYPESRYKCLQYLEVRVLVCTATVVREGKKIGIPGYECTARVIFGISGVAGPWWQ